MDCIVHRVAKSQTQLSDFHFQALSFNPFSPYRNFTYEYEIDTAAAAKSLQSCPTLCDPTDGSLPGSAIPGILQARTLEWVAISFSSA